LRIGHITLLVKDIDEALNFYIEKLGFIKREDTIVCIDTRWVTVSPKDQPDVELTLVLADTEEKEQAVGKQAGDHIFMTLLTDNFDRDYNAMKAKGIEFFTHPEERSWGIDAIFGDLYGNLFDLVQRPKQQTPEKL
jgi:catechol 2,3-dioxygenase-like lactoylglutathione lyase family enzyme